MSETGFSVGIRWRFLNEPSWEVESTHWGFSSAEDAALFANGFGERCARHLVLDRSRRTWWLQRAEGDLDLVDDVQVWCLSSASGGVLAIVTDEQFEQRTLRDLLAVAVVDDARLVFSPLHYGVRGSDGRALDVALSLDEWWFLQVKVEEDQGSAVGDDAVVLLSS